MPASRYWTRKFALLGLVCVPLHAPAQPDAVKVAASIPSEENVSPAGNLGSVSEAGDGRYSWNARLKVTSAHNSKTGWATLATPAAGHRFNRIFSTEAAIPIYFYRLAESRLPKPPPGETLVDQRGELGEFVLSIHARFKPRYVHYQLTGSITTPTGDETYGLSTGRVTFDISNHLQRTSVD